MKSFIKRAVYSLVKIVIVVLMFDLGMYLLDVPVATDILDQVKHGVGLSVILAAFWIYQTLDDLYYRLIKSELL